jgi:hypothetical protein
MKKVLFRTMLLGLVLLSPIPTMAGVDVGVSISLPPLIVFASPPAMVVIPETYVYVVPDVDADFLFYVGWWWRPWEGRWYRSRHYDSGWAYYRRVPSFYTRVPSGWRNDYREHRWGGRPWNYQPIPHQQVERNWSSWKKSNHWEKQQTWGVQGLKPRTQSQQPSKAVQQKPQAKPQSREASKPQQSRPQSRDVQPQQSRPKSQEAARPQQTRPKSGEVQQEHSQPQQREAPKQSKPRQGKPERGEEEKQDRK